MSETRSFEQDEKLARAFGRGKALQDAMSYLRSSVTGYQAKPECICDRGVQTVLCRSCGMTFRGRVRQRCAFHPNSIHLMDMECCPNCKASQIREFSDCERKRSI